MMRQPPTLLLRASDAKVLLSADQEAARDALDPIFRRNMIRRVDCLDVMDLFRRRYFPLLLPEEIERLQRGANKLVQESLVIGNFLVQWVFLVWAEVAARETGIPLLIHNVSLSIMSRFRNHFAAIFPAPPPFDWSKARRYLLRGGFDERELPDTIAFSGKTPTLMKAEVFIRLPSEKRPLFRGLADFALSIELIRLYYRKGRIALEPPPRPSPDPPHAGIAPPS